MKVVAISRSSRVLARGGNSLETATFDYRRQSTSQILLPDFTSYTPLFPPQILENRMFSKIGAIGVGLEALGEPLRKTRANSRRVFPSRVRAVSARKHYAVCSSLKKVFRLYENDPSLKMRFCMQKQTLE